MLHLNNPAIGYLKEFTNNLDHFIEKQILVYTNKGGKCANFKKAEWKVSYQNFKAAITSLHLMVSAV